MNKNPFANAFLAVLYIVSVVLAISSAESLEIKEPNILIPMVMISLLVLSVAIMGFLFVARPLELFLENQKHQAVKFFAKTVGTFAVIILVLVGILLYAS